MSSPFENILQSDQFGEEYFVAEFQSRLANLLEEKGISKAELARKLDVSRARISQIFSDDAKDFSIRLIYRCFSALGEEPVITTKNEQIASVNTGQSVPPDKNEAASVSIDLSTDLIAELLRANLPRTVREASKASRSSDDVKRWAEAGSNVVPLREKACA